VENLPRGRLHPRVPVGRQGPDAGTRLAAPRARPATVPVEERQVAARDRTPRDRRAGVLGAERLPHARRPVAGRTVRVVGEVTIFFRIIEVFRLQAARMRSIRAIMSSIAMLAFTHTSVAPRWRA